MNVGTATGHFGVTTRITRVGALITAVDTLKDVYEKAEQNHGSLREHAAYYRDSVIPAMQKVRESCDALEAMVDDRLWPLPKYREMLFLQ